MASELEETEATLLEPLTCYRVLGHELALSGWPGARRGSRCARPTASGGSIALASRTPSPLVSAAPVVDQCADDDAHCRSVAVPRRDADLDAAGDTLVGICDEARRTRGGESTRPAIDHAGPAVTPRRAAAARTPRSPDDGRAPSRRRWAARHSRRWSRSMSRSPAPRCSAALPTSTRSGGDARSTTGTPDRGRRLRVGRRCSHVESPRRVESLAARRAVSRPRGRARLGGGAGGRGGPSSAPRHPPPWCYVGYLEAVVETPAHEGSTRALAADNSYERDDDEEEYGIHESLSWFDV